MPDVRDVSPFKYVDLQMRDFKLDESDLLSILKPDTLFGALAYLVLFVVVALLISRALRAAVHAAMTRKGHVDLTTISFLQQIGSVLVWVFALILYAHLIPVLHSMGSALLAGASIASVVIGLAAQSTLGNLVAGIAITIYHPFRLGDRLQVATPTGTEIGDVEFISLGYTTLRTGDGRQVVLPNSVAASQVTLNLSQMKMSAPLSVTVRIPRDADLEAAAQTARAAAAAVVGTDAVKACYLKSIEATTAVLLLSVEPPAGESADLTRARLLNQLAHAFPDIGADSERATFS